METAERDPSGFGQRDRRRRAPIYFGAGAALSGSGACHFHWSLGLSGVSGRRPSGRLPLRAPDALRIQSGRLVHEATDSLEMVAGHWGPRSWTRWDDFSASTGRWL